MSRSRIFALACCLFCLIVGARWALIARYGSDLPEWDQWDAEGRMMFLPISTGQFHYLSGFWHAHNEHHIALTRLIAWTLTELNGQWDQRLEAAVNALLAAAIAAGFLLLAAGRVGWRWIAPLCALLAALYTLPLAWQNTLSGFDSQQFFLIGLAVGAVAWLPFAEPYRARWWAGSACVLLGLGSMASGFIAAAVVGGMLVFQVGREERSLRSAVPGLGVCAVAVAVGVMTRAVVPGHEMLKAQSIADWFFTTVKALGWPAYDFNWGLASLLLYVPWGIVFVRVLRAPRRNAAGWADFLAGLGLWVFFQVLATAYARGAGGPSPASRYADTLVVGLIVNLLCLETLWPSPAKQQMRPGWLNGLTAAWAVLAILGMAGAAYHGFTHELPPELGYHRYSEQNVRNYLATGDAAYLQHDEIPYPDAGMLRRFLDEPGLAGLLPVSSRRPVILAPASGSGSKASGFFRDDSRMPEALNRLPHVGAGLPPAAPVLSNAVTRGDYGRAPETKRAFWRSQSFHHPAAGWLKFELAGHFGRPGTSLEVHEAASDRVVARVRPDKEPGNSWRSAYVRAPAGDLVVVARDESPSGWMAFSEPVEMASGSYWAWRAVRQGEWIAALAASGGAVLLVLLGRPRPNRS